MRTLGQLLLQREHDEVQPRVIAGAVERALRQRARATRTGDGADLQRPRAEAHEMIGEVRQLGDPVSRERDRGADR